MPVSRGDFRDGVEAVWLTQADKLVSRLTWLNFFIEDLLRLFIFILLAS